MHWIVQNNFYQEAGFVSLIDTLTKFNIPHTIVDVVPFSHEIIPEINLTGLVVVNGSTTLTKIATKRGWTPGSFLNDQHDYREWKKHYQNNLLNCDAIVCRYDEVTNPGHPFFIRPCEDNKSFSGMVTDWEEFTEWQKRVIDLKETYTTLNGDTMVMYGPLVDIYREYRFFVVDGKVITQSQYKLGSRVLYSSIVDDDAIQYAQSMVDIWQPARAFVIDIALTDNGYKVIEINCISCSGFYAIEVDKFVMAIENMEF